MIKLENLNCLYQFKILVKMTLDHNNSKNKMKINYKNRQNNK